ncbi:MAG: sporulation membrane protein YtaF [Syntrophomonadales bacterium]|jgi:putative sporulation protein YtaF
MDIVSAALLALAVSSDGFAAGMAYGARKIRIPLGPLLLICVASMLAVSVSMLAGKALALYFEPQMAQRIGAMALMAVGLWFFSESMRNWQGRNESGENNAIATLRIKPLGIIIQILREPSRADLDSSGVISFREAFLLGTALALDALGAGMGASLSGYDLTLTIPLVGCCKFLLISLGLRWGVAIKNGLLRNVSGMFSGLILFILGFVEIMR